MVVSAISAVVFFVATFLSSAEEVLTLTKQNFTQHLKDHKQILVEFYAPWCGHCKKLTPEYEKAAVELKGKVALAKVDATEEKEISSKYNVKGFPTLVWFEDEKDTEYDGGRTADTIVEWVKSMTGVPVIETTSPAEPSGDKPNIVLYADSLLAGFEAAAKANRRKAVWYFVKGGGAAKVVLAHLGEDPIETTDSVSDQAKITSFLTDNALPLFGKLDGDSFEKYMDAGKGLVWTLFPPEEPIAEVEKKNRAMMSEVARKVKGRYFVTYTDTDKFKEAVESMLGVTEFPAIAVQQKAGAKKKFVFSGSEMTEKSISQFIEDVDAGRVEPKLKSEPVPASNDEPVRVVVGSTLKSDVFTSDKDVMLEVYAPWCGHCKKLEPEYVKLAKKIKKEELTDLLMVAKIDGTTNDSPVDSIEWSGFPSIFFVKAGSNEPLTYDGERTAKGLWKYIKKHASKAQEIRERLERRKGSHKKAEEL
jgi:protein disulfide-isomerase/protein disulfide-isomerase A1